MSMTPPTAAEQMCATCPPTKGSKPFMRHARTALINQGVKKPTHEQMMELGALLQRHYNANPTKPVPYAGIAQNYLKGE